MATGKQHARAPLFDRFDDPRATHGTTLDKAKLKASVRRELQRLFNTRCLLPAEELLGKERTVIDYGIPDFAHLSPGRDQDRRLVAESVIQAIEAYETRLLNVRVTVLSRRAAPEQFRNVEGRYKLERQDEEDERVSVQRLPRDEDNEGNPLPVEPHKVRVRVDADLVYEGVTEPARFDIDIGGGSARVHGDD